jgi:hypothetical protein
MLFFVKYQFLILMKYKALFFISSILFLGTVVSYTATAKPDGRKTNISIVQTDPLFNVVAGEDVLTLKDDTVRVARGENAVFQMVVSSSDALSGLKAQLLKLKDRKGNSLLDCHKGQCSIEKKIQFGWVNYVKSSNHYSHPAPDSLKPADGKYPDPIITDTTANVAKDGRGLLWIDIPIPANAKAGIYKGVVSISGFRNGKAVSAKKAITIKVYPVTLPKEQSLTVTNWYFPEKFYYVNGCDSVADDSPLYWKYLDKMVKMASAYGQNVWIIYDQGKPVVSPDGKSMSFDFTRMDKSIEFLLGHTDVRMIEAHHIASRSQNHWADPFWAEVPVLDGKGGYVIKRLPYTDPQVKVYFDSYFSMLQDHLRSKKLSDGRTWLDIYVQHIADEPVNENRETWEGFASLVKAAAPDIKIIEAYRSEQFNPKLIDYVVPQLNELSWNSYKVIPKGTNLWFYTCMYPRDNYANRYVTIPLIKTRILHWLNFKYSCTGYLHWGFNFWGENGDPMVDVSAPKNDWPGGDAYIIYPGKGKFYPSIRLAAMRDGIRDYDLLKMVSASNPALAGKLVDSIVLGLDNYNTSIANFRDVRKQMLEYLSKK